MQESRSVITSEEFSFISYGRKITVKKGEKLIEISKPNRRWVEVSRPTDSTRFFLPLSKVALEHSVMSEVVGENVTCDASAEIRDAVDDTVSDKPTSQSSRPPIVIFRRSKDNTRPENSGSSAHDCGVVSVPSSEPKTLPTNISTPAASTESDISTKRSSHSKWKRVIEDGQEVFVDQETNEKWMRATDEHGNPYYYETDSRRSVWTLDHLDDVEEEDEEQQQLEEQPVTMSGSTESVESNNAPPAKQSEDTRSSLPKSTGRFALKQIGKEHISGPLENKLTHFERRGDVKRAALLLRGKQMPMKWGPALMVLSGPWLMFHKYNRSSVSSKPEFKTHVQQLTVTETESLTLQLEDSDPVSGRSVFLVKFPENVFKSWKAALEYAKEILHDKERLTPNLVRSTGTTVRPVFTKLDNNLLSKLRDFFHSRPSADVLRARGILKNEPVFASTLVQICENENSEVPRFVVCAIRAIEARGIDQRGIYRLSGSAADVQKLRCCVDQYNYSLNSDKWDFTTITGALKLFFRELAEPLVTFDLVDQITELLGKKLDDSMKTSTMRTLLSSMPACHYATAKVLFHHLYRVCQQSQENRMTAQNLAMVFGPNLVRIEGQTADQDLNMLVSVQASFVNFCLTHVTEVFGPVVPPPVVP